MPLSSGTMCSVPYERRTDMCDEDMIYDCPCTVDCPRHRHCVSCIDHHRKLGWPLVACMQKMLKEHKAQKAAQKFRLLPRPFSFSFFSICFFPWFLDLRVNWNSVYSMKSSFMVHLPIL